MSIGRDGAVRRQLRTLFNLGTIRELTDGQLLERFAAGPDEAAELAFAALVERHGPMVLRVCRGVLPDPHDCEDALQATFLVLVRRARGLWVRDSLGPWLHQVAYRTASCARAAAARRRRLERRAAIPADAAGAPRDVELERLLHEEIDRLPERYRAPIVLCDLEGRSHEQAARHLGWPVGTVKSRLSRARDRLRDRLRRRGLAPEAGSPALVAGSKLPPLSIPPALLDSTASAAFRFATVDVTARGSAVALAEGVLRTMTLSQWWKVAAVLLVAGATASGVEWLGRGQDPAVQAAPAKDAKDMRAGDAPTHEVKPGRLKLTVTERGTVEAARTEDVYCRVEGQTTIIRIVPEGTRVKRGEVIAELDSAALRDTLVNQRIATKSAEAGYLNARLTREVAEIALQEYIFGILRQQEEGLKAEIAAAEKGVHQFEERLERTRRAHKRLTDALAAAGAARAPADILAEVDIQDRVEDVERALDGERRARARAESRKAILEKYTRAKSIKQLESEVKKTNADELARSATWELEKSKEVKLEQQISYCTVSAPVDGVVIYANDPARIAAADPARRLAQIEEGATVRERQKIIAIFDFNGPLQVNVKIPEAMIAHVAPRMKARIKVDAFPDEMLVGLVSEVAPLPDPPHGGSLRSVYTTRIQVGRGHPGLRPGMTAQARIVAADQDDVLTVPVGAVVHYDGKDHAALKTADGRVEWRDVVLGVTDGASREVMDGLRAGDRVILDPEPFLTDEQRARRDAPPEPAPRKAAVRKKGRGTASAPR